MDISVAPRRDGVAGDRAALLYVELIGHTGVGRCAVQAGLVVRLKLALVSSPAVWPTSGERQDKAAYRYNDQARTPSAPRTAVLLLCGVVILHHQPLPDHRLGELLVVTWLNGDAGA